MLVEMSDLEVRGHIADAAPVPVNCYSPIAELGKEVLRLRGYLRAIVRGDFKEIGGGGDWVFDCGGGLVPEIRAWDEEDRRVNP